MSQIPRAFKIIQEQNVPVRMRDGVTLRADVFRPDAPGRYPVILMRTPYGKEATAPNAKRFVPYGYVFVTQDTRGRFDSEGDSYYPLIHEANDGYDTVEWAAAQPWSDGNVGTTGQSYLCASQYLLAPTNPPHLRAMFATSAPSDWHECWVYRGAGVLDFGWLLPYCLMMVPDHLKRTGRKDLLDQILEYYPSASQTNLWDGLKEEHFRHLPIYDWVERLKDAVPYLKDYLDHPGADDYWQSLAVRPKVSQDQRSDFPCRELVRRLSGRRLESIQWHRSEWRDARSTRSVSASSSARGHISIRTTRPVRKSANLISGPEARIRLQDMAHRWFDYWLKGINQGVAEEKPVTLFVMGDNVWREENEWPLARTQYTPFYLHSAGKANTLNGDGTLSAARPQSERTDSFVYDPADPVPTRGGSLLGPNPTGACDQRPVETREDVLVYTGEAVTSDLEITGPIQMKLFAASTAPIRISRRSWSMYGRMAMRRIFRTA